MRSRKIAVLYIIAVTVSLVTLTMLVHVMDVNDKAWDLAGAHVKSNDAGNKLLKTFCQEPKPTVLYPLCEAKVQYIRTNWKLRCYAEENNITDMDLCSILIYLSEIEKWCPRLPWRETNSISKAEQPSIKKTKVRNNVDGIIKNYLNDSNYKWMQIRIKSMEKDWKTAVLSLSRKRNLSNRSKKKILVFVGAFQLSSWLLTWAFSGGPLGELVQWSDVITSLHMLGHDITFVKSEKEVKRFIPLPDGNGCINKDILQQSKFDLLYTDIAGFQIIRSFIGPYLSEIRCKIRVIDSFGTEAEFNFGKFRETDKKYESVWGILDLNLRQFMTMFPHSPDNSFIGFVSGSKQSVLQISSEEYSKKNKGLVYGKLDYYWNVNKNYLDEIHKHVEIHGTFNLTQPKQPLYIPKYVINHGVVSGTTIQNMLKESKVFVGLGFPYEGPAPLEAVANGAAFLNPKFSPPHNRYNSPFFKNKPTRRLVTSQNPYAEKFIGQPFVYTIDINNSTEVGLAMRKIMKTSLKPYLPYEYTHEGMLERISAQVENLDLCHDNLWPPLRNMVTVTGILGQTCEDACWEKGLLCEPSYWSILNQVFSFKRAGITCDDTKYAEIPIAPSYDKKTRTCYFQQQPLLYSCVSSHPSHIRLCPCRDFTKGQVALCKGCW